MVSVVTEPGWLAPLNVHFLSVNAAVTEAGLRLATARDLRLNPGLTFDDAPRVARRHISRTDGIRTCSIDIEDYFSLFVRLGIDRDQCTTNLLLSIIKRKNNCPEVSSLGNAIKSPPKNFSS